MQNFKTLDCVLCTSMHAKNATLTIETSSLRKGTTVTLECPRF